MKERKDKRQKIEEEDIILESLKTEEQKFQDLQNTYPFYENPKKRNMDDTGVLDKEFNPKKTKKETPN